MAFCGHLPFLYPAFLCNEVAESTCFTSDESELELSEQCKVRPRYEPVLYCDGCCLGRSPEGWLAV